MGEFALNSSVSRAGENSVHIVRVEGPLDAHTFPALLGSLEEISDGPSQRVVLDCERLEYISSAGLGILNRMVKEFRGKGGDLRLARLSTKIQNIVNLLGFSRIIRVFDNADDAISSYRA